MGSQFPRRKKIAAARLRFCLGLLTFVVGPLLSVGLHRFDVALLQESFNRSYH